MSQGTLFDVVEPWRHEWRGMPAFVMRDLESFASRVFSFEEGDIRVHFATPADQSAFSARLSADPDYKRELNAQRGKNVTARLGREWFSSVMEQPVSKLTRSMWFPVAEIGRIADKRWVTREPVRPRYPLYVISKGRWEKRLTADSLEEMGLDYHIVVEPQERDAYASKMDSSRILVLPFSNLGQGSIPARNWVWEHSVAAGARRHWIIDDNIDGFYRLTDNLKVQVATGATFRAAEDFTDRYENVAMSGMNYFMFASRKSGAILPYTANTRIYSCILLRNDLDLRWRGRYNEDTDLSIRILKSGLSTVLFNAFLCMKTTTMTMKGGNTEELYKKAATKEEDGRWLMAESLRLQHPELVQITEKWGRYQHHVDYHVFERNRLVPRTGLILPDGADEYGMELQVHSGPAREEEEPEAIEDEEEQTAEESQALVHFECREHMLEFGELIGQRITEQTREINYPEVKVV